MWYPIAAPNDDTRAIGEALVRYEAFYRSRSWLRLAAGFDGRADTHDQTKRAWHVDWSDREIERPAIAVRRLTATIIAHRLTIDVGKQLVRWGRADILNPTDRFAPRDFLTVVDSDFLPVTAVRVVYQGDTTSLDLVWVPRFTPSRIPLLSQRWTVFPETVGPFPLVDGGARFPRGGQVGGRLNHVGQRYEAAVMVYHGYNHLPELDVQPQLAAGRAELVRRYPRLASYGADVAVPLRWVTVKAEAAFFGTNDPSTDRYVSYVIQVERQAGEWVAVAGYAGEVVTASRGALEFSPERGFRRSFLARASYTIDVTRSLAFEAAVRQNGRGSWTKMEYSQAAGAHWRTTATLALIRGRDDDFLGQYHRNSYGRVAVRYSF